MVCGLASITCNFNIVTESMGFARCTCDCIFLDGSTWSTEREREREREIKSDTYEEDEMDVDVLPTMVDPDRVLV